MIAEITIECPHCFKQIEIDETKTCPFCHKEYELCEHCGQKLPDIDDYGILICNECLADNPEIKHHLDKCVEADLIREGEDDHD